MMPHSARLADGLLSVTDMMWTMVSYQIPLFGGLVMMSSDVFQASTVITLADWYGRLVRDDDIGC